MRAIPHVALLGAVALAAAGCGGSRWVQIPPRIDLHRHEILGVIEFSSTAKGNLAAYTTRNFIDQMRADQGMVRIVELGPEPQLLKSLGLTRLDRQAFQTIGERHGITTLVAGVLEVSNVRPAISIRPNLTDLSAGADVDASLAVQMIDARSGASIWSRTAEAARRVGHVSLLGGKFDFDADDPDKAYGELVRALVQITTTEFKIRWEKRKK